LSRPQVEPRAAVGPGEPVDPVDGADPVDSAEVCADAATLASFVDGELTDAERNRWAAHLAGCASCRETLRLLALSAADDELAGEGMAAPLRDVSRRRGESPDDLDEDVGSSGRDGAIAPQTRPRGPARSRLGGARIWLPLAASLLLAAGLWTALRLERSSGPRGGVPTSMASNEPTAPGPASAIAPQARPSAATPAPERDALAESTGALVQTAKPIDPDVAASAGGGVGAAASVASGEQPASAKRRDGALGRELAAPSRSGIRRESIAPASQPPAAPTLNTFGAKPTAPTTTSPPSPSQVAAPTFRPFAEKATGNVAAAPPAVPASAGAVAATPPSAAPAAADALAKTVPEAQVAQSSAATARRAPVEAEGKAAADTAAGVKEERMPRSPAPAAIATRVAGRQVPPVVAPGDVRRWDLGTPGMIRVSTDAGVTWTVEYRDASLRAAAGSAPSADVCWIVGAQGLVLRRTATQSWTRQARPVDEDLVAVVASDESNATVTTAAHATYRTRDGGRTWQLTSSPPQP
jgi:hypothetical protein